MTMENDAVEGMKVEKTRKKKRSVEDKENTSQHDGSDIRKSRKAKKEVVKEQDTIEDEKKSTKKKKKKEIEVDDKLQGSDGAHKVKKAKNDSVKEQPRRPRTRSMDAMDQNEKNEPGVNDDMQNGMRSVDSSGNEMLANFPLSAEIRGLLENRGIKSLFPIQSETFHPIFKGQDLIGRARTGMGKTLAFVLPIVQRLSADSSKILPRRTPRVLVMAPTRELAKQVNGDFEGMFIRGMKGISIYGGAPYRPQEEALRTGVDVVVGTPGRIVDHINRGNLKLGKVEVLILDEADHMLDMGFKDEMESVFESCGAKTASNGVQILLFSATMPDWVKKMATTYMSSNRIIIDLVGNSEVQASVDVRHMAVPCHWSTRASSISDLISVHGCGGSKRIIVFCQTKKDCNELSTDSSLKFEAGVIHGDITQANRESALNAFKKGSFKVLVATDVAARGLDMIVDLVINTEPPTTASGRVDTETYVHRSGRTGRAGRKGVCITLYTPKQRGSLKEIATRIGNAFSWEGAPQPKDIIGSSVASALEDINRVDEKLGGDVLAHFHGAANSLIQELGAEQALCCALACMTGHTEEMRARSLLSNSDNFVTMLFKSPQAMFHTSHVWSILRNELNPSLTQSIRGLQLTEDKMAAVFDIPAHDVAGLALPNLRVESFTGKSGLVGGMCGASSIGATEYRDNLKVIGGRSRGGRFDRGGRGRGGGRRGWSSRGRGGRR